MKLLIVHEIEVADDASTPELFAVLAPASATFKAAMAPVGKARLARGRAATEAARDVAAAATLTQKIVS